jgi:protein-tyrosine-phosphatase
MIVTQKALVLDGHSKAAAETVLSLPPDCEIHVAAHQAQALAFASRRVAEKLLQPDGVPALQQWLAQLDREHRYRLIVPSTEASLLALKPDALDPGLRAKAVLPSERSIDCALSKQATAEAATALGIAVPAGRLITGPQDVAADVALPVVVKPVRSKVVVDGKLRTLAAQVCGSVDARNAALRELLPLTPVVEQAYFQGRGVGIELLFDRGRPCWIFAHERLHEMPVTGGASSYRRAIVPPAALRDAAVALLERLAWHGVAMVEFKLDAQGAYRLIEINPRLWGSLPLAVGAGFNFPLGLWRIAQGESPGPQPSLTRRRHARDLGVDARWFVQSWKRRGDPLLVKPLQWQDGVQLLRPLAGTERWDLFRWRDLGMWWASTRASLGDAPGRWASRLRARQALRRSARNWRRLEPAWARGEIRCVLVLCYGNICRSPLAALELARHAAHVEVISAGFHDHTNRASPAEWIAAVQQACTLDLTPHRSRRVDSDLLSRADLVLVMDERNWQAMQEAYPQAMDKTVLLGVAGRRGATAAACVPDPYGLADARMREIAAQVGHLARSMAERPGRATG